MRPRESDLQIACVRWFAMQYPQYRGLLFAVPNGGSRNRIEAARMKAEGTVAGVSDLILLVPRGHFGALCIELKTETGRLSPAQKEWLQWAEMNGNKCVVVRDIERFIEEVTEYLSETSKTL